MTWVGLFFILLLCIYFLRLDKKNLLNKYGQEASKSDFPLKYLQEHLEYTFYQKKNYVGFGTYYGKFSIKDYKSGYYDYQFKVSISDDYELSKNKADSRIHTFFYDQKFLNRIEVCDFSDKNFLYLDGTILIDKVPKRIFFQISRKYRLISDSTF